MGTRVMTVLLMAAVGFVPAGRAAAQTITAAQVDAKTIRVVAPGKFETDFTLRKGFGATWFDLKHDPDKKRDLAPVAQENGFFWVKNSPGPERDPDGASWYANPAQEMKLLEAGPARVRVALKGQHMRYGGTEPARAWKELGFEHTWTLYPTGSVYGEYVLVTEAPVVLHHFLAITKSSGAWGQRGKGEGANEVHPASESGDGVRPSRERPASWVLQYSNGPTYFADILMVFRKGKFGGTYWNEGYEDQDYRTGLDILTRFPDATVPAGRTRIEVMFRIADDMNTPEAAARHANAYRSPDALEVTKGALDKSDPGDFDGDGYNECEGCYVLKAAPDGAALTLHGKATPRPTPVFKVKGWPDRPPTRVSLGPAALKPAVDYNASVADGVLLLQLLRDVTDDTKISLVP